MDYRYKVHTFPIFGAADGSRSMPGESSAFHLSISSIFDSILFIHTLYLTFPFMKLMISSTAELRQCGPAISCLPSEVIFKTPNSSVDSIISFYEFSSVNVSGREKGESANYVRRFK